MSFGAWSSVLKSLTIPQDASGSQSRVVVGLTEFAEQLGQDQAITFFWRYPDRAYVLSVEDSGGLGTRGQIHLWAGDENRLSQFIDADFDVDDPTQDAISLGGLLTVYPFDRVEIDGEPVPLRLATSNGMSVSGIVAETVIASLTADVVDGRTYRLTALINAQSTVATDQFDFRVREDNISGTVVRGGINRVTPGLAVTTQTVIREFEATSTGEQTYVVTASRVGGGAGSMSTFQSQSRYTLDIVGSGGP